jgi:hypothetical protein
MIHQHVTPESTARIARTVLNVAVCRPFILSVLYPAIDHHDKYRPRIVRLEMCRFAGLSSSTWSLRSVRSMYF